MSPTSCWFLEYRKIPASKTKYLWNRNKKSSFKNWLYPEDITGSVNIRQDGRGGVLTLCQPFSGHFLLLRRYPSQIPGMVNSWGLSPPVCNSIWQSSITSQSLIIYMQREWESSRFEVHWLVLTLCDTTVHIKYKTQCSNRINWSLFSTNCHPKYNYNSSEKIWTWIPNLWFPHKSIHWFCQIIGNRPSPHLSRLARWQRATAARVGRLPRRWILLQAARQWLAAVQCWSVWIHFGKGTSDSTPCSVWLVIGRDALQSVSSTLKCQDKHVSQRGSEPKYEIISISASFEFTVI